MAYPIPPLPAQEVPMFFNGVMTPTWREFLVKLLLVLNDVTPLKDFANDAAAAAGGIRIGQHYRNGSTVQVRVT